MDESEAFRKIEVQVRELTGYTDTQRILKGFSFEEKYLLSGGGTKRYLVRIAINADPDLIQYKQTEFELIRRLRNYSSFIPEAYAFGISDDEKCCFMILDYLEGTDGETALNKLSDADQYRVGVQAGEELKKMHKLPAPKGLPDWYEAIRAKYTRKIAAFDNLGLKSSGIDREQLSRYILENISCIRDTDITFLHGDYHPSNLVLHNGNLKGIIDFNRYRWGDPVHDFIRVAFFTRAVSIPFSVGQVEGYNGGYPSMEFWKKYSLYCALTLLPDLLWAYDYSVKTRSPGEIKRAEKRVQMVYTDHEGFSTDIPRWYLDYYL
jgi:aminoglycoside phosphotransferase (APT) family kinase protein